MIFAGGDGGGGGDSSVIIFVNGCGVVFANVCTREEAEREEREVGEEREVHRERITQWSGGEEDEKIGDSQHRDVKYSNNVVAFIHVRSILISRHKTSPGV